MHLFYVVWDYTDERFFDKRNSSDCSQYSELLGLSASGTSIIAARLRLTRCDQPGHASGSA